MVMHIVKQPVISCTDVAEGELMIWWQARSEEGERIEASREEFFHFKE